MRSETLMGRSFFITLETYKDKWRGCLTIGQHSYLWSSTDVRDAHLLSTDNYDSIEGAIATLKAEMLKLFHAFSVA